MRFTNTRETERENDRLRSMRVPMRQFGKPDGVLVTRDVGTLARSEIERALKGLKTGLPIALDFSAVIAVSVPFVEEGIARLLSGKLAGFYEDHPIFTLNANPDVAETIAASLRPRRLVILGLASDGVDLLGGDGSLNETMQIAHKLRSFTTTKIASELDLTLPATNNRLKALLRAGALTRKPAPPTRGGREFSYEVPDMRELAAYQRA